jgi:hypothetical protein
VPKGLLGIYAAYARIISAGPKKYKISHTTI